MPAWGWALIVIGAAAILAFAAYRVWRTRTLRQRFGNAAHHVRNAVANPFDDLNEERDAE